MSEAPETVHNSPLNLNFRVVLEVALGIILGLGVAAAAAVVIFPIAQKHFGIFSYNGLTVAQVQAVAKEMDAKYKILVRTSGSNFKGHRFFRGLYATEAGLPLYYKYEYHGDGQADLQIYPMLTELFTTYPDTGKTSGKLIYPPAGHADHHRRYRG